MFVTLSHKKSHLLCLTVGQKYCLLIVAATAAGHYAKTAFSNYQHKIGLRQCFFPPPRYKAEYCTPPYWTVHAKNTNKTVHKLEGNPPKKTCTTL